ncbi:hypothetical protein [Williamsoniiplasma lucivorax]|uniref:Transposase n=1 Tax=Williamsoniiplasma lucivorax TaxID=209274 RepID=A0A2S5RFH1_9MOLU|nr:hypothetical protein [Williamsoniiplasma lucivorax]PPE06086.1 hypothetical protein ELUCI_v1c03770 [Williamsoniiplasma lucivorax]
MKIRKIYSDQFKRKIAKEYFNGKKATDLAKKHELSGGVQQVYSWFRKFYPDVYYNMNKEKQEGQKNIMKNKENQDKKQIAQLVKALEESQSKVKTLEKEKELDKQLIDILKTKNQVLEKSKASCANLINQKNLSKCEEQKLIIENTKIYKHYAYIACYELLTRINISQNKLIKFFNITKKRFIEFKKRHCWPNFLDVRNGVKPMPKFKKYQGKVAPNAKKLLNKVYKVHNKPISAADLNQLIFFMFGVRISIPKIREIQNKYPAQFKHVNRKKTKYNSNDRKEKFTKKDLLLNSIEGKNAFGIDGVHYPVVIKGTHKKPVIVISYDLRFKTVVGFHAEFSETSNSAYQVFMKTSAYIKANDVQNAIIQTDRGSAFVCEIINNLEKEANNYTHSMSKAGFKHNPWTESLNGWVKHSFIEQYGKYFNSLEEFKNTFQEFINSWNVFKISMYNLVNANRSTYSKVVSLS